MPSTCEQADEGGLDRAGFEKERRDVTVEMVDRHERQPAGPGERLRRRQPDQKGTDQPRAPGDCNHADVVE